MREDVFREAVLNDQNTNGRRLKERNDTGKMNSRKTHGRGRNVKEENFRILSDRELRLHRRAIRLRRERRRRMLLSTMGLCAAACIVVFCTILGNSVKSIASDGFKYYTSVTIESGDTLWSLADEYIDYNHYKNRNNYISEIKNINHLNENGSITAGQQLIIPYYSKEYIK